MALNLPNPGQNPWANQLNTALETLDEQTVVDGAVVGDNLVLTRNDGTTVVAGNVRGPVGAPGGSDASFASFVSNPASQTGQALNATIADVTDGAIGAQVPGLVAQYAPKAVLPAFRRDPAAILSSFQASHGWTTAGTGAAWTEDTSTYVFGTRSLRVVTGTGQTANVGRTGLPAIDGTARTFRVWVKCDDWSKVNRVNLLVSSDPTFAAYFNLTAVMNGSDNEASRPFKNGEWVPIEYSWVDRTVSGSPARTALTAVRVLVAPETGQVATVNIGRVEHVPTPAPFPNGVFTYTLDDSHVSAYTRARPKLSALGHRATLFPINERIDGGAGYLTSAQVSELVRIHGWEFGAHADTYANHVAWNGMSRTQRLAMLSAIKSDQNARGFNDSPSFAYPNGHYTQASTDDVRQFYSLARQAGGYRGQLQTPVPFMSMRVRNSSANAGSGTLATLQARLDAAVAEKAWMVVVFHDIVTGSATGNDWSQADFDTFADYVASSGIAVATMQEVLRASAA